MATNIFKHQSNIIHQKPHPALVLWFTGLSGSGKSTLAHAVEEKLYEMQYHTFVLDGDNMRNGLCSDLGFSDEDRIENIRRTTEVVKLFFDAGLIVLTAFISPFRSDRNKIRQLIGNNFIEIYCDTPLSTCETRDIKGLYKLARAGKIKDFTGISSPYEKPENPEITIDTVNHSIDDCVNQVIVNLTTNYSCSVPSGFVNFNCNTPEPKK
ncbi:adenylyl-sulfate kinase [Candidatus Marithrix sp. Canyon 246]|uniref:adenylyl-sulfate kinase n=1 Tax=Candidatus Marithrix sp. Canyon 246 TaxID=1827136 RepID=UPI001C0B78FC|nr:adenylyl-sulfate kinase [Candidatus Marithrix sp. Canyon 246]